MCRPKQPRKNKQGNPSGKKVAANMRWSLILLVFSCLSGRHIVKAHKRHLEGIKTLLCSMWVAFPRHNSLHPFLPTVVATKKLVQMRSDVVFQTGSQALVWHKVHFVQIACLKKKNWVDFPVTGKGWHTNFHMVKGKKCFRWPYENTISGLKIMKPYSGFNYSVSAWLYITGAFAIFGDSQVQKLHWFLFRTVI